MLEIAQGGWPILDIAPVRLTASFAWLELIEQEMMVRSRRDGEN